MASRLAQRRKMQEDEMEGVSKRRKVTAPTSSPMMSERERAKAEKIARRQVTVPQTQPDVETAPVSPPTTIQTKEDMSNTLKDILQPKQDVKPDVLSPPKEIITNTQNIRYDPETDKHTIVSSTPTENLKTIEDVVKSIPTPQASQTAEVTTSRSTVEARLPKRSYETPQQYSERIDRVIAQEQKLASKGISAGERQSAIVKQAQEITQKREDEQKAQAQIEKAYYDDPWVQERLAMKEARAREDAFFNPIVQGLTDTMDVLVHALPVLGGSAGGVLAQAYKNFAPPTSKYYQDKSMEDKTISFLKDNVTDKVKDLGTGIAMSQVKNAVNLAKGYRGISLSNKTATKNFGIGSPSVHNPVAPLRTDSQFYVPRTTPTTSNINVGRLPARPTQAPQRLNAPRTDVLISPRSNVVRR